MTSGVRRFMRFLGAAAVTGVGEASDMPLVTAIEAFPSSFALGRGLAEFLTESTEWTEFRQEEQGGRQGDYWTGLTRLTGLGNMSSNRQLVFKHPDLFQPAIPVVV